METCPKCGHMFIPQLERLLEESGPKLESILGDDHDRLDALLEELRADPHGHGDGET